MRRSREWLRDPQPLGYVASVRIRPRLVMLLAPVLVTAALGAAPATAVSYAQVEGSGSTWAKVIVDQWIADVSADGIQASFTGNGSRAGRRAFAAGTTDFAVTELPYQGAGAAGGDDPAPDRDFRYVPIASGALTFTYQLLVDGKRVENLRLSAATLAGIFTNQITRWDDPAIAADNGGRTLPAVPVIPVVRSDGAAETYAFTSWLAQERPSDWAACNAGHATPTAYFPLNCGDSAGPQRAVNGNDQAMNAVKAVDGDGAIAYVANAYVERSGYPVTVLKNPSGRWVRPDALGAWAALREASVTMDGSIDLPSALGSDDPDAYPIVYVAHLLLPTGAADPRLTTAKRQSLADFVFHAVCEGQSKARVFGFAPLPKNLAEAGLEQLVRLKTADPNVNLTNRDLEHCENPTFDPATGEDVPPGQRTATVPRPTISGLPKVGQTLAAEFTASPDLTYTYRWNRDGEPIPRATGGTYVPQLADVGRRLSVTVTPRRPGYVSEPQTSEATARVAANPVAIKRPTVKVVTSPTRTKAGKVRVSIAPLEGTRPISGPSRARITLTLGKHSVTRTSTLTFRRGVAVLTVPRLPAKGRWKASVTVVRSHLVAATKASRPFTVRVAR